MLAAFVGAFVTPLVAAEPVAHDCPPVTTPVSTSVLVAGMDGMSCERPAAPCGFAIGCIATAPAMHVSGPAVLIHSTLIVTSLFTTSHLNDLYRTGPPTPPPNQI